MKAIRKAVERGLSEKKALAALTTVPARLYDLEGKLGSIATGKIGNLTIATGDLFADDKAIVAGVWVDGEPIRKETDESVKLEGVWTFTWKGIAGFKNGQFKSEGDDLSLKVGDSKVAVKLSGDEALFFASNELFGGVKDSGIIQLQGFAEENELWGNGLTVNGRPFSWQASRTSEVLGEAKDATPKEDNVAEEIPELVFDRYPAGAYGVVWNEKAKTIIVRNATIWTSGSAGILPNADLLIRDGKSWMRFLSTALL